LSGQFFRSDPTIGYNSNWENQVKTKEEREKAFREDLQKLLDRHNAEINITDDRKPYGMHNAICIIELNSDYTGNKHIEYHEFEL